MRIVWSCVQITTEAKFAAACVRGFQLRRTDFADPRNACNFVMLFSFLSFFVAGSLTCEVVAASMGLTSTFIFSSGMSSSSVVIAAAGSLKPRTHSPGWTCN